MNALSPCAKIVQTHHRSAYLFGLLSPEHVREHLFALYAFNYEIEHIRTTVSEEMVGMIRLQWWRDAIAALYEGKSRNHDVVQGLEKAIAAGNIKQEDFETYFRAHEEDYSAAPFKDMDALIQYADGASVMLLQFVLKVFDIKELEAKEVARYLGRAEFLCNHLRLLPFHLQEGWCTLPESLLHEHGTNSESVLAGEVDLKQIEPVIQALAVQANQAYLDAEKLKKSLSKDAIAAFRMARLLPNQIKQFKRQGASILHTPITLSPVMTPLRLWHGW